MDARVLYSEWHPVCLKSDPTKVQSRLQTLDSRLQTLDSSPKGLQ